ncbi:hypothetical protein EDB81DRAFT_757616 [Dactylonectria macrodidyma]|uniref:Clr5 domain-containing protein n=1 Tax=Dactylonectria macrodidyma TaxID=307937 RepID=A0A9P9F5B4_9HYPO|nr:hypothetical protein EDB81DRAFT_757616 [Dactylonectria macrodidyma]
MQIAEIVVRERTNDQSYTLADWNSLRPLIEQLYKNERRTRREIVDILGEHFNFHVKLGGWDLRKYQTKRAAEREISLATQPSPPNIDCHKENILNHISTYVDQSFSNGDWTAAAVSTNIIGDYLNWLYDNPHPLFKFFSYLRGANICFSLDQSDWARKLIYESIKEFETCLQFVAWCSEQPYQVVQVILALFIMLSRELREVRKSFLKHCFDLTQKYHSPHHRLLAEVIKMEQERQEPGSQIDTFAKALTVFVDKTSAHFGQNTFAYSLCKRMNQALGVAKSQVGESAVEAWEDPQELQLRDVEYFNSSDNIEQTIVLAVEFHGYKELLQLREALKCQVDSASTSLSHEMVSDHLRKLEKPIHRIACRDFWKNDDQNGFMEHWRFMVDGEAASSNLSHLFDMLFTLRALTKWGKQVEAQFIKDRLEKAFRIPSKPQAGTFQESRP